MSDRPANLQEAEAALEQMAGPFLKFLSQPVSLRNEFSAGSMKGRMDEARFRTLVELLPAITFMASLAEGLNEAYVSPQIEQILGFTHEEWLGNPILWYERLHPEDRERWNLDFARTVALGDAFSAPYRFIARNGKVVWLQGEVRIMRDENGRPLFIHGVGFDITKIKEAERQSLEYLERLKKINAELEQFAHASAHDLQEPLRTVISYAQILGEDAGEKLDGDGARYLSGIINAGKRMKGLIEALLQYSRIGQQELPMEHLDMEKVLESATENVCVSLEEASAIISHDPLPAVTANRVYMTMLLQNLIGNALRYRSAEKPKIHVSARWNRGQWVFSVRDNGIGIAPEHHEKVFQVFQRLHSQKQYPGTGIGLAICRKIVELHGGRIWVDSELGSGANFQFTIPQRT